jgi:hypothetical protein
MSESKPEFNKYYSFDEISEAYPNKWAILTDVIEKNGEIIRCKLLDICTISDLHIYRQKYKEQGIIVDCMRTTPTAPNVGVLTL